MGRTFPTRLQGRAGYLIVLCPRFSGATSQTSFWFTNALTGGGDLCRARPYYAVLPEGSVQEYLVFLPTPAGIWIDPNP